MSERALAGPADQAIAQAVAEAIWDKKGYEVVALEVTEIVGYTDMMVICSATSVRHASAIADGVMNTMRTQFNQRPMGKEGDRDGRWVLLDYGDFVVHVFHSPVRDYYELDRLYADADKVPLEEPEWLAQAERERLYANTADWSDDSVEQIDANWEEQESSPADEENASADP